MSKARKTPWKNYLVVALVFAAIGFMLKDSDSGRALEDMADSATTAALSEIASGVDADARTRVLIEHPSVLAAVAKGGGFGGKFSRHAALNMFGRVPEAIEDLKDKTTVEAYGQGTWLIRMPIVNAVLFETAAGLVLVDTGMAPAGPAIVAAIKSVSDKPLHTIIYTHGHVDHAYGTWALLEAGWRPEIIAHKNLAARVNRYIRLRGSIAQYMSQKEEQMPRGEADFVWPTQTFVDRLELDIGGERFVLQHHRGETDDQLYVWAADRKVLASADYYQGFLPNAGNGKRAQRHLEEWAVAMREMAALNPEVVLPAHGAAITDSASIQKEFTLLADALQYVVDKTIEGLNKGLRKDEIFGSMKLPPEFAKENSLREHYVSIKDLSKMVLKQYTGWWDDIPSHWSPATQAQQGALVIELAGGIEAFVAAAYTIMDKNIQLACHMADWAWFSNPTDARVQQLVIDAYKRRAVSDDTYTQEKLAYIDAMARARDMQLKMAK